MNISYARTTQSCFSWNCSESTSGIGMKSVAVKFHPLNSSVRTLRSSPKPHGYFKARQWSCSKCCEASHRLIVLQKSPEPRPSLPPLQDCSLVILSGGLCRETRRHTVRSDNAAARPPFRTEKSEILSDCRRHPPGTHRGLALVCSMQPQDPRCATWRFNMEANSILSRLAHYGRHRLWQNQFRH